MKAYSNSVESKIIKKFQTMIPQKKLWKKFFFGLSIPRIFQILFDFEFINNLKNLGHVKLLVLVGLFLKISEKNITNISFHFLQIQEEHVWGRFFLLLYFSFFLKRRFLSKKINRYRTDLRLIWKLKNLDLEKMEYLDETERSLNSHENVFSFLVREIPKNKSFSRSVKLNIHIPLGKNENFCLISYSIF